MKRISRKLAKKMGNKMQIRCIFIIGSEEMNCMGFNGSVHGNYKDEKRTQETAAGRDCRETQRRLAEFSFTPGVVC